MNHIVKSAVKGWLLLLFAIMLLGADENGCDAQGSDGIEQQTIFTEYVLRHEAEQDRTYIRAAFFLNAWHGKRVELTGSASVRFEGMDAEGSPVAGTLQLQDIDGVEWYELEAGGLVTEGTFFYTNNDGETLENQIQISPETLQVAFPAEMGPIDRMSEYQLSWQGAPLGVGEEIWVQISDENQASLVFGLWSQKAEGAMSIAIDPSQWPEGFPAGERPISLTRTHYQDPQQATEAGAVLHADIHIVSEVMVE